MPTVYDRFSLVTDFEIRGDQVRAIPEQVRGELLLTEALIAVRARGHGVAEAVLEQEGPLFIAEVTRLSAVEVDDLVGVERNRIALGYRPAAARTTRLSHLFRRRTGE